MSELRLLEHFIAVYRGQSFRAGAEQMGVSQSTITKSIQRLEKQLGLRLFNRTTRTVEPTDTARQLLASAEDVVNAAGSFNQEAKLLAGGELGGIRVGAIALAAETLIVKGLARLAISHPKLDVEVVVGSSDVYRDLATGSCDLVVGDEANFATSAFAPSLRMTPLHSEDLVYVYRPQHPASKAKTLAQLLAHPLAIPSRYFNENKLFAAMAMQTGGHDTPRYRLNSLSACLMLAATTDIVTLAPRSVAEHEIVASNPPTIEIAQFATGINIRLAVVTVARNTLSPAVRAFQSAIALR